MALTKIKGAGINISATEKLYFDGGGNTYIHESAADVLKLVVGGVAFMDATEGTNAIVFNEGSVDMDFRVESNGNANMLFVDGGNDRVGIGTASPNTLLQVGGTVRGTASIVGTDGASPYLKLDHTATTSGRAYSIYSGGLAAGNFDIYDNTASAARLSIDSSGRVGIGTSSPSLNVAGSTGDIAGTVLHIKDTSARADLTLEGQTGARLDLIDITGGSNTKWLRFSIEGDVGKFHSVNDDGAAFNEDNILVMDLASGNVGIGTDSPLAHLTVSSNSDDSAVINLHRKDTSISAGNELGKYQWLVDDPSANSVAGMIKLDASDTFTGSQNTNTMTFQVGTSSGLSSKMKIYGSNGTVYIADKCSIGTPSPTAKLHVLQSAANEVGLFVDCSEGTVNSSDVAVRIRFSGDADASGAHFIRFEDGTNTTAIGSVSGASGTEVAFNTSSDYRLKTDLKDLLDATDTINKLKLYNFKWKKDGTRSDGIIAHEVQQVYSQPIFGDKDAVEIRTTTLPDGTIKEEEIISSQMVDYSKFVPLLLKAVQELSTDNDALKSRIEALENA